MDAVGSFENDYVILQVDQYSDDENAGKEFNASRALFPWQNVQI